MAPNDSLPVALLAAVDYPDTDFREHLWLQVESWVNSLAPRFSASDVSQVLAGCDGTVLEPFSLEDSECRIATLLGQIAFSKEFDQTRFRVVSNQTLGDKGGCVLTNNLKHFYVERFALGKKRRVAQGFWRYAPRNKPSARKTLNSSITSQSAGMSPRLPATAELAADGYQVDIAMPDLATLKWPISAGLSSTLSHYSNFGNPAESLRDLGIAITTTAESIRVSPASPEATMRLTALMLSNRLLVLSPGPEYRGAPIVYVRLALPEEGRKLSLNTLVSLSSGYFVEWINLDIEEGPVLTLDDRRKIAEWIMPPNEWVENELLETI